jgi:aldose 1-epimerase
MQLGGIAASGLVFSPGARTGAVPAAWAQRDAVVLENDLIRVVVSPSDGAGMLAFAVKRDGEWIDVSPSDELSKPAVRCCSWMMVPYSNRIENGVFRFEGKEYRLRNGKGHAIHGDARNHPWKIETQSGTLLRLSQASLDHADFNWPWPLGLEAEFALEGNLFTQRLSIRNRGTTAMPAGFGWHPYYLRTLTPSGETAHLQMKCTGVYPDTDGNCIPSGPPAGLAPAFDFSQPKAVPSDRKYDHCFNGYDGKGTIAWPGSGVKLEYDCSPNVTHLVFYNPPDKPWFAVEPAANANNGVNLLDRGDPTHGVIRLPAAGEVKASFGIRVTA